MQVKIAAYGEGLSYRGFGLNAGKRVDLLFRNAPDEGVLALRMEDAIDVGGDTSMLGFTYLVTQWFAVNVSAHEWLFHLDGLVGRFAEFTLTGGSLGNIDNARVHVELALLDKYHEVRKRFSARGIAVIDGSINVGQFKVGSTLKRVDSEKITVYDPKGNGHLERTVDSLKR